MASGGMMLVPAPDLETSPYCFLGEGAANIVFALPKYVPQYVRQATPEPTEIEEYGPGTPPPSEIGTGATFYYESDIPEEPEPERDSKSPRVHVLVLPSPAFPLFSASSDSLSTDL
jgi:hypothetical protein